MDYDLEQLEATLRNKNAGWVNRRDAAQGLRDAALAVTDCLKAHAEDSDTDVRMAAIDSLARLADALGTKAPPKQEESWEDVREPLPRMVGRLNKTGVREVHQEGNHFSVKVQQNDGREQTVYVAPFTRKDGLKVVSVFTYCGEFSEEAMEWALRANAKMVQGALGVVEHGGKQLFNLSRNFLEEEFTYRALKAAVKEIAYYGDWIENRMTGLDDF